MKAPTFWHQPDSTAACLLTPLGVIYDYVSRLKRSSGKTETASAPVICVGNLVAGGAGKTPVALALAAMFADRNLAFLTRGYGGRESGQVQVDPSAHTARDVGDEALLLARAAPTWVARDRPRGAQAATRAGADLIIMDDGFQNPSLAKDVSLIVVDGATGFGNVRVMPAGPLRETVAKGLSRADAVILMGDDTAQAAAAIGQRLPIFKAQLRPVSDRLTGRRVLAFAGIGRPQKFFDTLLEMGCKIVAKHEFADHQPYKPEQIMRCAKRQLPSTPPRSRPKRIWCACPRKPAPWSRPCPSR